MSKRRALRLIGPVAASREARAVGGMGALGLGVGGGLGFWRIASSSHAVLAVAEPRPAPIPSQGASELASVAGAGLVGADHTSVTMAAVVGIP